MSKPVDIEIMHKSKKPERLRIRQNTKYVRTLPTKAPDRSGVTPMISTEQGIAPTVSLDFEHEVNRRRKSISHMTIENGQLTMDVNGPISNRAVTIFPAGVAINPADTATRLGKIDINLQTDEVLRTMQIVEPDLKSLSAIPEGGTAMVWGDIGLGKMIPTPYMGEGTAKLLAYITAVIHAPDGILLIDEIENGFHYSVLPEVWKALFQAAEKHNCQIIATTHSLEAINAMASALSNVEMTQWCFIRIDSEDNKPVFKYYSPETLLAAMERSWEVR